MFRNAAEVGEKPTAKRALKKRRARLRKSASDESKWRAEHHQKRRHPQKKLRTAPSGRCRQGRTIAT